MRVHFFLPALTEATSPFFRPIKYSLFPPLGLAALAAYLHPGDEAAIFDEHVEPLRFDGPLPHLVAIETYITNARRAYAIADHFRAQGVYVVLGGLHATSRPAEAAQHADTVFTGPGEDTWPRFLADFRNGRPAPLYASKERSLLQAPLPRRDLIRRSLYLVPNSIVVSRGCPHHCDFCYKDAFFAGGRSYYTRAIDTALAEIDSLPGRHLYFLDDHLLANRSFADALFHGMKGMNRVWQAAATVDSILDVSTHPRLLERAVQCGLRSLFIGFESISESNLQIHGKRQNRLADYTRAIQRLHSLGVMINASFVYGMDDDGEEVFSRTVEWAIQQSLETATFHILTPYPGTGLHQRLQAQGRILHNNWDLYDTRHAVFQPARMSPEQLEAGYWRSYRDFYRWSSIARAALAKHDAIPALRHFAYSAAWKKLEPLWDLILRARRVALARPALEAILDTRRRPAQKPAASPAKGLQTRPT
ncbi:MAG: radical SAM protein [Acidobacteria bacterium]|nr:radical SAM protein [Acidobacteriota bacterium]